MAVGSPGAGRRAGCAFGAVRLPAVPVYRPALPPVRHDPGLAGRPAAGLFRRLFLSPAVSPGAAGAALRRPPGGAAPAAAAAGGTALRRGAGHGAGGGVPVPAVLAAALRHRPLLGGFPPGRAAVLCGGRPRRRAEKRKSAAPLFRKRSGKRGGAFLRAAAQARGRFTLRPPGGREPRPVPLPGRQSRWNTRQGTRRWSRFSGCCPVSPGNGRPAA